MVLAFNNEYIIGSTPLMIAVKMRGIIQRELRERIEEAISYQIDYNIANDLHRRLYNTYYNELLLIIKLLIEKGADINIQNENRKTAFMLAIEKENMVCFSKNLLSDENIVFDIKMIQSLKPNT